MRSRSTSPRSTSPWGFYKRRWTWTYRHSKLITRDSNQQSKSLRKISTTDLPLSSRRLKSWQVSRKQSASRFSNTTTSTRTASLPYKRTHGTTVRASTLYSASKRASWAESGKLKRCCGMLETLPFQIRRRLKDWTSSRWTKRCTKRSQRH